LSAGADEYVVAQANPAVDPDPSPAKASCSNGKLAKTRRSADMPHGLLIGDGLLTVNVLPWRRTGSPPAALTQRWRERAIDDDG
jgi:hypothetical protein